MRISFPRLKYRTFSREITLGEIYVTLRAHLVVRMMTVKRQEFGG